MMRIILLRFDGRSTKREAKLADLPAKKNTVE
jgi:hypothetical protein